ncbi:MAG: hypothetical protein ABIS26_02650 [Candidatus Paceibacterota bacterium]
MKISFAVKFGVCVPALMGVLYLGDRLSQHHAGVQSTDSELPLMDPVVVWAQVFEGSTFVESEVRVLDLSNIRFDSTD